MAKLLILNNANIEANDNDRKTPLHLASEAGQDKVVKVLIGKKANIDALAEKNRTALHYAAEKGHVNVIKLLLANEANTDLKDDYGFTPLNHLCLGGDSQNHIEAATILLDKNPEVINVPSNSGNTPLHYAAYNGYSNIKINYFPSIYYLHLKIIMQ